MFKANFRTAYLQREVPEDAIVLGDMVVGEMVEVDAATDVLPAVYSKLKATTVSAAIEEASHIIAQSDMTMEYGHVPVEYQDYKYSSKVASTVDLTGALAPTGSGKFLGVFAKSADLPTTLTVGDTALVLEGANLVKYKATSTSAISKDTTSAYSIPLTAATKKVAAFRIIDAHDLNIVEA